MAALSDATTVVDLVVLWAGNWAISKAATTDDDWVSWTVARRVSREVSLTAVQTDVPWVVDWVVE